MPTCPNGHQSGSDDWCEVCGHRMAGAVPPPPPPPPPAAGYGYPPPGQGGRPHLSAVPDPAPEPELCPQCRTPREGGAPFCEECRWNFLTNTATSYTPAAPRPTGSGGPGGPGGPGPGGPGGAPGGPNPALRFQQPPPGQSGPTHGGFDYQGSRPSQMNRPAEPIPPYGEDPSGFPGDPSRPVPPPPGPGGTSPGGPGGPGGYGGPGGPTSGPGGPGGQGGYGAPGGPNGPGGPGGPNGLGGPNGPGGQGGPGAPQGFQQPGQPGQSGPPGPPGQSGQSGQSGPPAYQQDTTYPQETGRPQAPGGPSFGGGADDWVISPPSPGSPGGPPAPGGPAGPGSGYGYPQPGSTQAPAGYQQPQQPQQPLSWSITIGPDREYFMAMMQRSGPEAAGLNLPAYSPEQQRPLSGNQITIGRRRHSTGDTPDIDLSVPPEDPGVSHQHAVLVQQPDSSWAVVDQNSTNGTTVNGAEDPIQPFVPVPLQDGDRVHVGAWTTITIRRG
ncbi:FHA domain-containing protein [Streptomyces sp. LRE541]|uniref:FHA domain-containing protein n=1 Tax=Streptomyces sp. LRE541 TaxID=2931983 RepID=UPI00201080AE|nr:FHA domain-containing protein [Streptomyces sp. LRE541]UPZ31167.1 FHA domain-containing protein [Streptomyces sp. LRE541]